MILICVNEIAGPTGYHKSVVETANALHRGGYSVAMLSFLGSADGSTRAIPKWSLDTDIPAFVLQSIPADGGRLLSSNVHPVLKGRVYSTLYAYTENQLAALRQINAELTEEDTVIFTTPLLAFAFHRAIKGEVRRARTMMQVHGDYRYHDELWDLVKEAKDSIDNVQTVAEGLKEQFLTMFDQDSVVCIPNVQQPTPIVRQSHSGVEIVLPASFQHRKNQLEAIKALSLIDDESVKLTLWGNISPLNPYFIAVQELIEKLGLQDRVRIPGFGTEQDVYGRADIMVMTSLSEGFPYPLMEAAFHKVPTVTYDYEFGPRDMIDDGESGFIVPVGDVESLAEKLRLLAADADLRTRMGKRAQEVFQERFATEAVVERYARIIGPPPGRAVDFAGIFSTDGYEPIAAYEIEHTVKRLGIRRTHRVVVHSTTELFDVQVDDGETIIRPEVVRQSGATLIEFPMKNRQVVSYVAEAGGKDRHYLAGPSQDTKMPVLARLRRDANNEGNAPTKDTLYAASGGARHVSLRTTSQALVRFGGEVNEAVSWKLRQILPTRDSLRASAKKQEVKQQSPASTPVQKTPAVAVEAGTSTSTGTSTGTTQQLSGVSRAIGLPAQAMGSVGRVARTYSKTAMRMLINAVGVNPSQPTRREIPRHPWFPVTSGIDNFGHTINRSGGVNVSNSGTEEIPTVSIQGEYDWLVLRDGKSQRRITPPWSYGEFFERFCEAEKQYGLFDITTKDGVHVWELGRSALVIQLAEAAGLWGAAQAISGTVKDEYTGSKRLTTAPSANRVVFDYVRRGQSGYRTAPFVDESTLFVVQPDADGYPGVTEDNMVYPFHEFYEWKKKPLQRWAHLRVPEVDARPFEAALTEALGIRVDLGDHLRNRLAKFLAEREFWTPVFERVAPEEVLIASSHWWAGIAAAAKRSGAQVSDIQYALTSHYAPSFWFGQKPHYGATRFYTWSNFWAERTNVYNDHVVVPREQPELVEAITTAATKPTRWDVCVIAQPRVLRRILAFVQDLVKERPELSVVVAPHPAQRATIEEDLAAAGILGEVSIAEKDTLSTIAESEIAVGTFSTSMWESAAVGRPTYVIEVPGYEETLQDIDSGLFRLARSPHDLVPYDVPSFRSEIFGV